MKIYIAEPEEIYHCGGCPNAEPREKPVGKWYCLKTKKNIPSLWEGEIPKWCPLPDKVKK